MPQDDASPTRDRSPDGRTCDPAGRRPDARSPLAGLAVGGLVLALVALPASWAGIAALVAFTGCFIGCVEPEPLTAALWAGVTLLLLTIPVATGVATARARRPDVWFLVALAATALVVAWYAVENAG